MSVRLGRARFPAIGRRPELKSQTGAAALNSEGGGTSSRAAWQQAVKKARTSRCWLASGVRDSHQTFSEGIAAVRSRPELQASAGVPSAISPSGPCTPTARIALTSTLVG